MCRHSTRLTTGSQQCRNGQFNAETQLVHANYIHTATRSHVNTIADEELTQPVHTALAAANDAAENSELARRQVNSVHVQQETDTSPHVLAVGARGFAECGPADSTAPGLQREAKKREAGRSLTALTRGTGLQPHFCRCEGHFYSCPFQVPQPALAGLGTSLPPRSLDRHTRLTPPIKSSAP